MLKSILKENRKAVCGLACGFTIAGVSFQNILDQSGFLTINVDARTTISPPERVARLISRFKPSVIVANETDFLAWMQVLKEKYNDQYDEVILNLKALISTAELCSINRSKQICKQFDIYHIDNYACVEGYFSLACPCGDKHILPIYHTEILSEDLKVSNEYGTGRFAFTNLYRKSTPFVRYLLDDLVTIKKSNCKYGFNKSIIPHGRYELSVVINKIRYGNSHFEELLFKNYLFGEYQVEIYNDKILIKAEDYSNKKLPLEQIKKDFKRIFKKETFINIYPYGALIDYNEIRKTKPILRLIDKRLYSTQKIPQYL
jgi:phenylacetate-CoA ligase